MSAAQSLATESTTPLYFEIETLFCPKPEGAENTEVVEMQNSDSAWLSGVRNDLGVHHYVYDHKGERVMKSSVMHSSVQINDQNIDDIEYLEPYTLYINPYYVVTELKGGDKVSKHYYMNTQRVATDISINYQVHEPMAGPQQPNARDPKKPSEDTASVNYNAAFADLQATLNALGHQKLEIDQLGEQPTLEEYYPELVSKPSQNSTMAAKNAPESTTRILFWYHPDYLGNVDLVTERDGKTYEFFTYNPWGEEMHQYNANTFGFSSPYRFNSKEKDAETGLHYYGARYYQSKLSVWLSVDPLAHETLEPYVFTGNNPVMFVDPDGLEVTPPGDFYDEFDNYIGSDGINDGKVYVIKTSETSMTNGKEQIPAAGQSEQTSTDAMNFVSNNSGNTLAFLCNPSIYDKFVELPGSSQERNDALDYSNSSALAFPGLESSYESATYTNKNGSYTRSSMDIGQEVIPGESQVRFVFAPMEGKKGWDIRLIFHSHPARNTKGNPLSQPPSLHDVNNSKSSMRVVHGQGSGKVYLYNNGQIQAVMSPDTFRR